MESHSKIVVLEEFDWIFQRPTIYLGTTTPVTQEFFFSEDGEFRKETYIPALHKLYLEIIENSIDEFIRTKGKFANQISVTLNDDGSIIVTDNGRGLAIEKHDTIKDKWVPEVIYTELRSGSNFTGNREGIGVNGLGSVLTNLFSNHFEIETQSKNKRYKQIFRNMLSERNVPKIKDVSSNDTYTEITFLPNFEFFKVKDWNRNLIKSKIIDLSYTFPDITFKFNGEKLKEKKYKNFVSKFSEEFVVEEGDNAKLIISSNNSNDLRYHSIVNGALCYSGGTQVDYIVQEIINNIRPKLEKSFKLTLKPSDIRDHICIFSQLKVINPQFSSQSKDKLINPIEEIKPLFNDILTDKFYKKILNNKVIVDKIVEEAQLKKQLSDLKEANTKQKKIAKKKVAKLIDACGVDRDKCICFLVEGDSAVGSSSAIRDPKIHAFLPLRGKVLNVSELTMSQVLHNEEISDIMSTIGLTIGQKAKNLRYGKIVTLMDSDPDGFCIKALLLNFFFKYWPELFEDEKVCFLKTPLYVANKNQDRIFIYNNEELEDLQKKNKLEGYKISYFKGLAGHSEEEWDIFLNKDPQYTTINKDDLSEMKLNMAFSSDSQKRKDWLLS